jgi:hypothetical protein
MIVWLVVSVHTQGGMVVNILSSFIDQLQGTYGDKYLQDAHLFTSVYMALRCLPLREHNLRRQQNKLAVVVSCPYILK